MATSNSWDWTLTRNDIITAALRKIGAIEQGETATAEQISEGSQALNAMIKAWQTETNPLWQIEWRTQSLTASSEVTGTDSLVYTCIKNHTSATNNKPITGAYYTDFWKQTGSTGGTWVTATAYAAIGNIAFLNTEILGITETFVRSTTTDTPVTLVTRNEYFGISDKTTEGVPSKLYFENIINPKIYLWPQPDDSTDILHYAAITRLHDFDAGANNPDFDQKWFRALIFNLAWDLHFEYGINNPTEVAKLGQMAIFTLLTAKGDSNEQTDLQIIPEGDR